MDASLPAQGYAIAADRQGIRVDHADAAGRRYAEDTLAQLRRSHGALPGLQLRDAPDFATRGYLLDVSRDRVPTRESLLLLVGRLARLRFNHLELYTEHAFAYPGHEVVWRDASPITPDDVHWLDALCLEHGIELSANQNTFGHLERWLRHDAYRGRAEAPDGWDTRWGARRPPAVLAPTPANADFALGLVRELMRHFTSRRVNIGCDETFELGKGRSRAAVASRGRGRVYLDHLLRLLEGLHADDREVLFWGDILRSHPELVAELPRRDTVALVWHYEAPTEAASLAAPLRTALEGVGIDDAALGGFGALVEPFAASDLPFWVCPGTSAWNSLVGRLPNARANLRDAVDVGRARDAAGFLLTDWGDNGHHQPPAVSLPPLLDAAGLAWNAALHRDRDLAADLDEILFEDAGGGLGAACVAMGALGAETGLSAWNASPLFAELVGSGPLGSLGAPDAGRVGAVLERIEELQRGLEHAQPGGSDGALVVRELRQALRLVRQGAWRLSRRAGGPAPDAATLREDLREAIAEQRVCWLARSRPGGLADSLGRLEARLEDPGA
jgi:hypothetical protein